MQHAEKELVNHVKLCDGKGQLNPESIGYARQPLIESNLDGRFLRKKKWNYWCVYGEEIIFSATISHLDYAAVCFVYFLHYETQRFFETTVTIPLSRQTKMGSHVLESCVFENDKMSIHLIYDKLLDKTKMKVHVRDFDGDSLEANLEILHPEGDESLNVVIPWNRKTFQFTAKHHLLPTSGTVRIGEQEYRFKTEDSFSILDYGRGVWPREAVWNWGMASQRSDGQLIGLNFGGQWTDGTGMTENAFFLNGKMTKIHEDVLFEYDRNDYEAPWTVRTKFSDDVDLTFTPFFERIAKTDAKLIRSEVHQLFGYYNGYVRQPDGKKILIKQLLGAIEEHDAKW